MVTPFDIVAGDPDDPRRITRGVPWAQVNVRHGLQVCSAALAEDPTNARLLHQMGRLLDIQSRYEEAEGFYPTEPILLNSDRLEFDVDALLMQQLLEILKR